MDRQTNKRTNDHVSCCWCTVRRLYWRLRRFVVWKNQWTLMSFYEQTLAAVMLLCYQPCSAYDLLKTSNWEQGLTTFYTLLNCLHHAAYSVYPYTASFSIYIIWGSSRGRGRSGGVVCPFRCSLEFCPNLSSTDK